MSNVLVLNASNDVITEVHWERAVTMVVRGHARVFRPVPDRFVRSQHLEIEFPEIIQLNKYVYIEHSHMSDIVICNQKNVLIRDDYTCGYCGKEGNTLDHIIPQSQGGKTTWDNSITACFPCNNKKANRTPREAGMRLRFQPYAPRRKPVYY